MLQSSAATNNAAGSGTTNNAAGSGTTQDEVRRLEAKIELLTSENRKLREEASSLEARAVLVSQHEEQRTIDAARFRAILSNNRSGIALLAPNGRIVEVVHSIFGYQRYQMLGRAAADIMLPESAERFRTNLEYVAQTPEAEHCAEYCIQNAAGEEKWVEIVLSDHISEPEVQAIVCNYRDITDRKLAEEKHALAESIIQSSACAMLALDFDGKILSWNPRATQLYGYSPDEMLGQNVSVLRLPGQAEPYSSLRQLIRAGQTIKPFDASLRHKSGAAVAVRLKIGPLRNGRGDLIGCLHSASVDETF